MAGKEVQISLKFLNVGLKTAAKQIGALSKNLTTMANAFKGLSTAQIKALMGEIRKGADEGAAATARLTAEEKRLATAKKNALAIMKKVVTRQNSIVTARKKAVAILEKSVTTSEKAVATEKKLSAQRSKAKQIIQFAIDRTLRLNAATKILGESKSRLAQRTIIASRSMTRFNDANAKGNARMKTLSTQAQAVITKYKKWYTAQQKIRLGGKGMFAGMASSVTAISTSITAVISVLSSMYMWFTRIYNVLSRVVGGLANTIKEFGNFQTIVRSASFILKTTQGSVVKTASTVNFLGVSLTQAAQGLDEFGRAGYGASEAMEAFAPIAMFADAVNTNLGRATTMVTGAMKSFGFEAKDVWRITSGMTNAVYDSRNSFETLETAFSYAGAAGAAFNQSFEDVLASTMAFRDLGLKASTSGTVYRRALARLANATKPTADAFKKLGLDINKFTVQSGNSFNNVIKEFSKLRGEISETDFSGLMGKTIGPRFAAYMTKLVDAVRAGTIDLDMMSQKLRDKANTLEELTKYNLTTIEQQIRIFTGLVERAWLTFGSNLSEKIMPFLSAFNVFALEMLDQWEITMDKMSTITKEGTEKITIEDMGKKFKLWEKDVSSALGSVVAWLVKYGGIIEKITFMGDVLAKTIALPFVLLSVAILKVGAIVPGLVSIFTGALGTVRSVLGTILNVMIEIGTFFPTLAAKGGGEFLKLFGLGDLDGVVETFAGMKSSMQGLATALAGDFDASGESMLKWIDTANAMDASGNSIASMYGDLVLTDQSAKIGEGIAYITGELERLQGTVAGGAVGEKIGDMVADATERMKMTSGDEKALKEQERIEFLKGEALKREAAANKAHEELLKSTREKYWALKVKQSDKQNAMIDHDEKRIIAYNKAAQKLAKEYNAAKKVIDDQRDRDDKQETEAKFQNWKEAQEKAAKLLALELEWVEWAVGEDLRIKKEKEDNQKKHLKISEELNKKGLLDLKSSNQMELDELIAFKEQVALLDQMSSSVKEAYKTGSSFGSPEADRLMLDSMAENQAEYASLLEANLMHSTNFTDQMSMSFEAVARSFGSVTEIMGTLATELTQTMSVGLGNAFMAIFDKSKKIKDVFKDMGKSMLQSLLQTFSKILLQTLIFGKVLGRTNKQIGAAQAKNDSANAAIAAYRSGWEAGHGWAGPFMAELFRGIAVTQTTAMTTAGGFFDGTGLAGVPGTYTGRDNTLAAVSPGEIILNNQESDAVREASESGGTSRGTTIINIYATDAESFANKSKAVLTELVTEDGEVKRAIKNSQRKIGA